MSAPVVGQSIGKKIGEALGLPPRVRAIDIRIAVDEVVTVTCEHYPDRKSVETVVKVLAAHEWHPRRFIPGVMSRFDVGHEMILPERAPEKRP